jgi:hypothetical protein
VLILGVSKTNPGQVKTVFVLDMNVHGSLSGKAYNLVKLSYMHNA